MNMKWLLLGLIIFAIFVGGMIFLAKEDQSAPSATQEIFATYAAELGLDSAQFIADMKSEAVNDAIAEDITAGNAAQINSTPTLLIDGQKLSFRTYAELNDQVNAAIAKSTETLVIPEDTHAKGATEPRVIITEFSDFECPACGTMAPIVKQLLEDHPKDLALIYKQFPLTQIHLQAMNAARATEAAALQGKFWEMHDLLFERQDDWN